jgi:hypothetical protein
LPNTQVALLIFGRDIKQKIGFPAGENVIRNWLGEARADVKNFDKWTQGRTALLDALVVGLDLLGTPASADSLYVISDGEENASQVSSHETSERLIRSGIRLFVIEFYDPARSRGTPEEANGPEMLADSTRKTGGDLLTVTSIGPPGSTRALAKLTPSLDLLRTEMTGNYRVEIELPAPLSRPRSWELKLSGEKKKQWKDARLLYPTQLAACQP